MRYKKNILVSRRYSAASNPKRQVEENVTKIIPILNLVQFVQQSQIH